MKVLTLVKKADLQRLKDGVIKFTYDNVTIKVTPKDDLISIKEETPKKQKRAKESMKVQVKSEEQQHDEKDKK